MFITNKEKDWMMASIQNLQEKVKALSDHVEQLEKINITKTPEAPWGFKLDGKPRKRPGRAIKTEVAS
jgi:tetrahydromethanopterin S-methyltransferase subunit B